MPDTQFDQNAWLQRIGYSGPITPTLETLNRLIFAHSHSIAYETLDIMLGRPPKLDVPTLQQKMIASKRGGYCFEQNMLFRAGAGARPIHPIRATWPVVRNRSAAVLRARERNAIDAGSGPKQKTDAERLPSLGEFGLNISDQEIENCVAVMKTREAYRKWAENGAAIFREYGCIEIVESWEDNVPSGKYTDFRRAVDAKDGEKIVFT
jgi:Protein of unknown function (DUF1428)/N-acetyltransferase